MTSTTYPRRASALPARPSGSFAPFRIRHACVTTTATIVAIIALLVLVLT